MGLMQPFFCFGILLQKDLMKYLLLFTLLFLFIGCDKDTGKISPSESEILGSWKMVRHQYSIGGPPFWEDIENGETIKFNDDLTFVVTGGGQATDEGAFEVRTDSLIRIYTNDAENIPYISNIELKGNKITLRPISPNRCIEGCAYEYLKIE